MIRRHQLTDAFPEFADRIHKLKVTDPDFNKLYDEYDKLDHEIYLIETDASPASDETLNQLRLERVQLKDAIFELLKQTQ
ncbi:YdcH family protein [Algoriphagus sp. CAU 1675]|uniref:YdcH family protein n=1 Tax=Algoriphagus sp. CAU 1675 TaxID=3032597 RepID=UPI0023D9F6A5|nr:YdcH family protein [Algoriphagus sp. CAU 1675]MDF2158371.1 YdcH family protein [Algoriphagus sp. CAU 1675]